MDFIAEKNRIYVKNDEGKKVAEITFPKIDEHTVMLASTFVDDSLRGQGMAGKLMEAAMKQMKAEGKRVKPVCSYAVEWLKKHEEYQDLIEE